MWVLLIPITGNDEVGGGGAAPKGRESATCVQKKGEDHVPPPCHHSKLVYGKQVDYRICGPRSREK